MPCTQLTPCPRVRLGVDEWGAAVEDSLMLYARMMGWGDRGGLRPAHPGLAALSALDLQTALGELEAGERTEILWRVRTFHRAQLAMMAEDSDGA